MEDVLRRLEKINILPQDASNTIDQYLKDQKLALLNMAESSLPALDNRVNIEKYFNAAHLLLKQSRVYAQGGIKGLITDKQVYFILTCRFYHFFFNLMDHPGFQKLEK